MCGCVRGWPQAKGYGAPEIATCGRDGCVRVWDVRQPDAPVAAFEPADPNNVRCAHCAAQWGHAMPCTRERMRRVMQHAPRDAA